MKKRLGLILMLAAAIFAAASASSFSGSVSLNGFSYAFEPGKAYQYAFCFVYNDVTYVSDDNGARPSHMMTANNARPRTGALA